MRRDLIHAVIRDLSVPANWSINGEYASEFSGFFPVQCRIKPPHARFHLALCSPGDINPVWVLMFINPTGNWTAILKVSWSNVPKISWS